MWTVILICRQKKLISRAEKILVSEGIVFQVRQMDDAISEGFFEILVPEAVAQMAHVKLLLNGC